MHEFKPDMYDIGCILAQPNKHGCLKESTKPIEVMIQEIQKLVDQGANLNQTSDYKKGTLLHRMAAMGWAKSAHALLKAGADPNIRDDEGYTPLDQASFCSNRNFIATQEILKEFGAKRFDQYKK